MNITRLLIRMTQLARQRPSRARVINMITVAAIVLAVALAEWLGLWPDWARSQRIPGLR